MEVLGFTRTGASLGMLALAPAMPQTDAPSALSGADGAC